MRKTQAEYSKEHRQRNFEKGLCRCGKVLEDNRRQCQNCSDSHNIHRKRSRKVMAVKSRGGKCECCGYESIYMSVYHFHHKNPAEKEVEHSLFGKTMEVIEIELAKCEMLCANCHAIRHEQERVEKYEI